MLTNLRELFQYRALVWALTSRELRARYRGSLLGFFWTFVNPLLLMSVYALVFSVFFQQQIPHYTFFMFVGLLPWVWFSNSVNGGTTSLSSKRDLLTRVKFPPQVLPAVVILAELVNYLLALPLMLGLGLFSSTGVHPSIAWLPVVLLLQAAFTVGLVLLTSALNVFYRDLQHVLANLLTLWFFLVPVIYRANSIPPAFRALVIRADPMAVFVTSYQAIFYDGVHPDLAALAIAAAASVLLLALGVGVFEGRRDELPELV
ncbi:MAG: ABC transporter permease [Deltaproteobacteria bacterium]